MAENTPPDGRVAEPALIYDAGERRTHAEHAAEAYDFARRADELRDLDKDVLANEVMARAQWHATMAVYELMITSRAWA